MFVEEDKRRDRQHLRQEQYDSYNFFTLLKSTIYVDAVNLYPN